MNSFVHACHQRQQLSVVFRSGIYVEGMEEEENAPLMCEL